MNMTTAMKLLEGNTARHFASCKALIDACDLIAGKIIAAFPIEPGGVDYTIILPRGYRLLTEQWDVGYDGVQVSRCLLPPDKYVAINSSKYRNGLGDHIGFFAHRTGKV